MYIKSQDFEANVSEEPFMTQLDGLHVLVVDDCAPIARLFADVLRNAGATVQTCGTLNEAHRALSIHMPDVLLSDISLPDGDACELLPTARAGGAVTIGISGFGTEAARGFDVAMAKPVSVQDLVAAVQSAALAA